MAFQYLTASFGLLYVGCETWLTSFQGANVFA